MFQWALSSPTPCCLNTPGTMMAVFLVKQSLPEDMGAGERSVRTYLKELETASLLHIIQRGLGKTNFYKLQVTIKSTRRRP